ncbi:MULTISPECIES: spore coat associated protein CotJA [unclassified Paenibacillus]|uniref:spore coat associated protein CotJA n=1 Tax=unclassified Paenibacillus TaxID=185978 RepID=UPI0006FBDBE5|nr:spore coat associated protein CotJA [Paenibacillus sp. Soil750]KRE57516.1 spore coat protein CotJA [Paenibacillus sp. Soil750]
MYTQFKSWYPYIGPCDPCPPIRVKWYNTPPQLYMHFQPPGLPQFSPYDALKMGTLWPALYGPYPNPLQEIRADEGGEST